MDGLFDPTPYAVPIAGTPVPPGTRPSPDVRRRSRQQDAIAAGAHPLSVALRRNIGLHPDAPRDLDPATPGPRCGTCWYRRAVRSAAKSYPKCHLTSTTTYRDGSSLERHTRITHGPGTDVKKTWPACVDYSPGDSRVSPDAARWTPGDTS